MQRILVVEDEPVMNRLVSEILAFDGYKTESAASGEEALESVERGAPDAVLLDIMLPGISGYEVCHQLKCSRETNMIPLVVLTALDRRDDRVRGIRVGADAYVTKPFDPAVLVKTLEETVARVHQRQQHGVQGHLSLAFQSDLDYLARVNDLLLGLYAQSPLSEKEIQEIRYCLLEMGRNAIEWGNRGDRDMLIHIEYTLSDDALRIVIRDEGEGFSPRDIPHAASDNADPLEHTFVREKLGIRDGGFGILLSQNFMDEVSWNERGNQVTLVKRFKRTT